MQNKLRIAAAMLLGPALAVCTGALCPGPTSRPGADGLPARSPWITSRVKGSPDPPHPYDLVPAFPRLRFTRPIELTGIPGTDRLLVAELDGKIYSFRNDPACDRLDLALDLVQSVPGATKIYGLTFDPGFEENREIYVCYVLKDGEPAGTRVSRFRMPPADPPRIDPTTEAILITWLSGGHNGGCLKFGADGCLYISTGDATPPSPPDALDTGQDVSDLLSSILRIDVHHPAEDGPYTVPADNPFTDVSGIRPEIWAYGFRNPWKMCFDPEGRLLWLGDVGWELWEMVYRVERGGNYGWSVMEGRQTVRPEARRGPTAILPPVVDHPHTEAASITGGFFYRGSIEELAGAYIYGDFVTGKVWGLRHDGARVTWHRELADTPVQIVAFGEDNAGELYAIDYEYTGQVYRITPNPVGPDSERFPTRLSETGLFASTRDHEPAPGVVPYRVNAQPWLDGGIGERLLALPGSESIDIDKDRSWKFPEGTVLVRTISMDGLAGRPGRRRLETQILHFESKSWRPYTYAWDDEQIDATLVEGAGSERVLTLPDPGSPGGTRQQTWRFASRTECALCHNPWAGHVLGFTPLQINRNQDGDGTESQIRALERAGFFAKPVPESLRLVDPHDDSADLDARARSYLDVNCAHCHRSGGGGTATIQLVFTVGLGETGARGLRPAQGAFGISDARIVAPGDPEGSVLHYRMATLGPGRMPRVGSTVVDEEGLDLIHHWIARMPADGDRPGGLRPEDAAAAERFSDAADRSARDAAVRQLLSSTRGSLALLRFSGERGIPQAIRRDVAGVAMGAGPEVRGLFERFVPESERARRLGNAVNVAEIVSLAGDSTRGEQVFFENAAAQCKSCHRVRGKGTDVGPDLSRIAEKYPREALLEQILDPSKLIAPEYVPYLIETRDGRVFSGLLTKRTGDAVELKDAAGKQIQLEAGEVQLLVPQQKSLMPDLLVRDLTPQDMADLLEYLLSLR